MTPTSCIVRPATGADQSRITEMIRNENLYLLGLKWQRFLVAEDHGAVIGIVQLKTHCRGARELASLAVSPTHRHQGVAARLIDALLANTPGTVYLTCHVSLEAFYQRFGFHRLSWRELPLDFKRIRLFLWLISPLAHIVTKGKFHILIMGRGTAIAGARQYE